MIDKYGIEKFKTLWNGGFEELETIYGFNSQQLKIHLTDSVNEKYPNDIEFNWEEFDEVF